MFTSTSSSLLLKNINSSLSLSPGVKQPKHEADYTLQSRHIKHEALIPQFEVISLRCVSAQEKNYL
jgi:hypothetical protein